MKTRRILSFILAFILVFPATSKAAKKATPPKVDDRARNIYELFTKSNPKLSGPDAKKYAEIVIEAAEKHKQDPYVIAAVIVHESTVNNKAVSKGGDYGLMQIRWKVHEKAIKKEFPKVKKANDIFDARTNIFYGTEILAYCMKKADNDMKKGLLRYSAGNEQMAAKVLATVKELKAKDTQAKRKVKAKKGK